MGDGFRGGKTTRDDVLLTGGLYNGRFTAFVCIFAAALAGVGVVNIFMDNGLSRDEFQSPDNFLTKEYESLKLEIIKAVQGESAFPMEILSELVNNARTKMLDADARLSELTSELEESNQRVKAIKADYDRIMEWSEIFDSSDMEVKKMIAGYIIKRVEVYSDYRLHIEFNMNFAQFELGLEIPNDYQPDCA